MGLKRQYRIERHSHNRWFIQWSWMGMFWSYLMDSRYYNSKHEFRSERDAEVFVNDLIKARTSDIKKVYK